MNDDDLVNKCRTIADTYGVKCLEVMMHFQSEYDRLIVDDPGWSETFYDAMILNNLKEHYKKETGVK